MDTPTTPDTVRRCAKCGGELIGDELNYTTCGDCGGRALPVRPEGERRMVATVTTRREPTVVDLTALETAYAEEGYTEVELIPSPVNFEDPRRGWEVRGLATNNPYR